MEDLDRVKQRLQNPGLWVSEENQTKTRIKLNYNDYTLEWRCEVEGVRKISLSSYLHHTLSDTDENIELKIATATHHFLHESKVFSFTSREDRHTLSMFLASVHREQRDMTYTHDLTYHFHKTEFKATDMSDGREDGEIKTDRVKNYFSHAGGAIPKLNKPKGPVNFKEWRNLYSAMMSHPSSTLLQRTFNKYATSMTEAGSCKLLSFDNMKTFLERHQNENDRTEQNEGTCTTDELSQIMRKHTKVIYFG
jgi:hypothetical protein